MPAEIASAIKTHQSAFGLSLTAEQIDRLAKYYSIVMEHNALLHLVAPCSPEEFAIRHILESLTLLEHLPQNAKFADVGTGAGLPSIPCLLVREDLTAVLIESKQKKAAFIEEAIGRLGLRERTEILNRQFEETDPSGCQFVTCRALDKFTEKLPRLVKWSRPRQMLLFGGPSLRKALESERIGFEERLAPLSEQRYLFVTAGSPAADCKARI